MKKAARTRAKAKAPARKKPAPAVPHGFHSVTPQLTVRGADQAIDFYKRAFGAKLVMRIAAPDGTSVMHGELRIGDSIVFVADEFPDMGSRAPASLGGATGSLHVYVPNVDAAFKRAVAAGAQVKMPLADMFWGDRYAQVLDPFGHEWGLATHKETLTNREVAKRAAAAFKAMGPS